jgi:hypothetical protein
MPTLGVLAAEAVRQLSQFVLNGALDTPDSIRVLPVTPLELPALRQYYYVPVTDSVLSRTVANPDTDAASTTASSPRTPAVKRPSGASGASSANKTSPLPMAAAKAKVSPVAPNPPKPIGTAEADPDDEGAEEEEEEEDDGKLDDELQAIEEMESASCGKPKKGKANGKASAKAKAGGKKGKAKAK